MRLIYIILLLCISILSDAQYANREVGIRGGYTGGFTFRVNIEETLSYEGHFGYRNQGAVFGLIRQRHREIGMDRHGNWEFLHGYGVHAGFYFTDSYRIFFREVYFGRDIFTPVAGLDGYLAVEYRLVEAPVTFGISFQPHMEISLKQVFGINLWDFGVNVKYRF